MNPRTRIEKRTPSPRPSPPQVCGGEGGGAASMESWSRTHLINRSGARGERFGVAARREEGEYPQRSSTDEQRRRRAKEPPPSGLAWEMPSGVVAPRSQPQGGDAPSSRLARGHFPGQRALLLFMRWVLMFKSFGELSPCPRPAKRGEGGRRPGEGFVANSFLQEQSRFGFKP